jgi:hypothetical protein
MEEEEEEEEEGMKRSQLRKVGCFGVSSEP